MTEDWRKLECRVCALSRDTAPNLPRKMNSFKPPSAEPVSFSLCIALCSSADKPRDCTPSIAKHSTRVQGYVAGDRVPCKPRTCKNENMASKQHAFSNRPPAPPHTAN